MRAERWWARRRLFSVGHPSITITLYLQSIDCCPEKVLKVSRSFGYDIVPLREMKERDFALHLREPEPRDQCVIGHRHD
jgi:hypothetical protein